MKIFPKSKYTISFSPSLFSSSSSSSHQHFSPRLSFISASLMLLQLKLGLPHLLSFFFLWRWGGYSAQLPNAWYSLVRITPPPPFFSTQLLWEVPTGLTIGITTCLPAFYSFPRAVFVINNWMHERLSWWDQLTCIIPDKLIAQPSRCIIPSDLILGTILDKLIVQPSGCTIPMIDLS